MLTENQVEYACGTEILRRQKFWCALNARRCPAHKSVQLDLKVVVQCFRCYERIIERMVRTMLTATMDVFLV